MGGDGKAILAHAGRAEGVVRETSVVLVADPRINDGDGGTGGDGSSLVEPASDLRCKNPTALGDCLDTSRGEVLAPEAGG